MVSICLVKCLVVVVVVVVMMLRLFVYFGR